jgi:hypothetical protein
MIDYIIKTATASDKPRVINSDPGTPTRAAPGGVDVPKRSSSVSELRGTALSRSSDKLEEIKRDFLQEHQGVSQQRETQGQAMIRKLIIYSQSIQYVKSENFDVYILLNTKEKKKGEFSYYIIQLLYGFRVWIRPSKHGNHKVIVL